MFQQKEFRATPSAQLRELLGQLEAHIGKLSHDPREEVQKIPVLFDEVHALIAELDYAGIPLSAEVSRFETASATLRRKARLFLRKVGGREGLAALRPKRTPSPEQWWWFIDQWLAEQGKAQRRRELRFLLIFAAVLVVLAGAYTLFLRPDESTRERLRLQQAAEQLAQNEEYAIALQTVNEALTWSPDDASLLAFKGVLETQLGLEGEAAQTFAAAEAVSDSLESFYLTRAQVHLTLGMFEAVLADAEATLSVNPKSARGHLFMAQANANLGNVLEAQRQFEEAARLANEMNDVELEAIARIQLAYLYQQMLAPLPTATTTP